MVPFQTPLEHRSVVNQLQQMPCSNLFNVDLKECFSTALFNRLHGASKHAWGAPLRQGLQGASQTCHT